MAACPICNKSVAPRSTNSAFPFCSARCKSIDLGKWLSEEYRVPVESGEAEDEELESNPERAVRH